MSKEVYRGRDVESSGKTPRSDYHPDSVYNRTPSWRIRNLEVKERYGWHVLEATKLFEIREKLACFETMTWSEIFVKAKKRNHQVRVNELTKDAQRRLEELGHHDLDELASLRLTGPERVWGIFRDGVMSLLWWDPKHEVCPSRRD